MGISFSFRETVDFIFKPGAVTESAKWLHAQNNASPAIKIASRIHMIKKLFFASSAATIAISALWAASVVGAALPIAAATTTAVSFYALLRVTKPLVNEFLKISNAFSEAFHQELEQHVKNGDKANFEDMAFESAQAAKAKAFG